MDVSTAEGTEPKWFGRIASPRRVHHAGKERRPQSRPAARCDRRDGPDSRSAPLLPRPCTQARGLGRGAGSAHFVGCAVAHKERLLRGYASACAEAHPTKDCPSPCPEYGGEGCALTTAALLRPTHPARTNPDTPCPAPHPAGVSS